MRDQGNGNFSKAEENVLKGLSESKCFVANRVKTFSKWPFKTTCSAKQMAEAGFYCTGPLAAKCYFCDKELDGWEEEDVPMSEHEKHSPLCPFVLHAAKNPGKCSVQDIINIEFQSKIFKMEKRFQNEVKSLVESSQK